MAFPAPFSFRAEWQCILCIWFYYLRFVEVWSTPSLLLLPGSLRNVLLNVNDPTVLFLTIQFSTSHLFALILNANSSIKPIDRTLSGATTPGHSEPESDGNEGALRIPHNTHVTETSHCFGSYTEHSWGSVLLPLQRCSRCILQPQPSVPPRLIDR